MSLADNFKSILNQVGEDTEREGLLKTPERAAKAIQDLTSGYSMDPIKILNEAVFHEDCDQMIIVRDIEFHSLCEHHILPFMGTCDVAYVPNGKIIGLSKIPRIVDMYAKRLQVQERLTQQVANALTELLDPKGVAVVCRGQHTCMSMRGVQKQNAYMITNAMEGVFRENHSARQEFLQMIKGSSQ